MSEQRLPNKKLLEMWIQIRNVNSLNEIDKLESLNREMKRLNLHVIGVNKVR